MTYPSTIQPLPRTVLVGVPELTDHLAAEWDELACAASEPNSFYERWFVEASLEHLDTPDSLKILTVRDKTGLLIGVLPLRSGQNYGRMPLSAVQNWLHYNQFLGIPLVRKGAECAFWQEALSSFDRDWPGSDVLYFSEMAADGPVTDALRAVSAEMGRPIAIVHRYHRAILEAGSTPDEYWATAVRKKKRKEIARLENRLAEIGPISVERLQDDRDAASWTQEFLALEAAGWKAQDGAALATLESTRQFFIKAITDGLKQRRVEILRLRVGDQTIAMLVNFLADGGAFSFKISYDEGFSRYSPGILIEKANLHRLDDPAFSWMDSCAVEDHPMINSLWRGRREIVRIALPRKGARAALLFHAVRLAETSWSAIKQFRNRGQNDNGASNDDHDL